MKTQNTTVIRTAGRMAPINYLSCEHSVRLWLLTTDHKRIGILYLGTIIFFFAIASVAAAMMRIELLTPQGDLVTSESYNKLFTIHGVLMVCFFLIPSIPAVLGNFVIPMMIGARDVAFPRLNLLSWHIFLLGGALALWSLVHGGVAPPPKGNFNRTPIVMGPPYQYSAAEDHDLQVATG